MATQSTAYFKCLIALCIIYGAVPQVNAQPVVSANNLALGGGGAAYLNGLEANFYNPANLMIFDRKGRFHFGAGNAGGYFQPVLSTDNIQTQITDFRDIFLPHNTGSQSISASEREQILEQNYPRSSLTSQHQARADVILAGIQWRGDRQAYSLVARTRTGTRIEVGRGWYSDEFIEQGSRRIRDFHLTMQNQVLHEISFGYAREFELINGLLPQINKLYIGIAPKVVAAGAYMDAVYNARYETDSDIMTDAAYRSRFMHHSSGAYSDMINHYRSAGNLQSALNQHLDNYFSLSPTGYGAGIDFGLTYMISLGSDVSILNTGAGRNPVERSLRISFSVTDLGVIHYNSSPLSISGEPESAMIEEQEPVQTKFTGAPGQFLSFFEHAESLPNPLPATGQFSESSFSGLLPTSFNAGALLDLNRLRLMGDLTLALNKTAFSGTQLTAHLGMEAKPVSFLPIRLGTRLAAGAPVTIGLGTGINTRYWNFSVSSQVLLRSSSLTSELVGGAVAGLQFHL